MNRIAILATRILAGAERVIAGIEELRPFLVDALPAQDDDLGTLDVVSRIASIALLKRFEQLQDQTARLGRAALEIDGQLVSRMTVRDVANGMEKRLIVEDADEWVDLNALRNQLVHEYPVGHREQVDRVNECWAAIPLLLLIHARLRAYLLQQGVRP